MKKTFLIILLFNFSLSVAQTEKDLLSNDIKGYIKAINNNDIEKQIKYYPKFAFDSISKEEYIKHFKKASAEYNNSTVVMDSVFTLDTIMTINSVKYARINTRQQVTMDLSDLKDENGMSYAMSMMYGYLVHTYGEDNVSYKKGEWIFHITNKDPTYAIKEDNWTFLQLSEENEIHIPKEIRKPIEK